MSSISSRFLPNIGDSVQDIPTPALLVDLDILEQNIKKLPQLLKQTAPGRSVAIRAHAKAHKCPDIAKLQMSMGNSIGVCCQKISEVIAMLEAGIPDVLISNEIVAKPKLKLLAQLVKQFEGKSKITVCVDNAKVAQWLSDAAVEAGVKINVLVDVNVGQDRCGVEHGQPAVALVQIVKLLPGLVFKGIQAYQGNLQHVREAVDRELAVVEVANIALSTVNSLKEVGIECEIVTGAGTGTFQYESASGVFNEIQPGSYIFMDADYLRDNGGFIHEFKSSLFVASTCVSVSKETKTPRVVVDAGLKALSIDSGSPLVKDHATGLVYSFGGDEHGIITAKDSTQESLNDLLDINIGDVVLLVPGHCDPTVNMHENIIGVRNGKVETIWPLSARGVGF